MSDINTDWTDLVADSEQIADDLLYEFKGSDNELNKEQFAAIIEFVQVYIQTSIETVLEFPEWFDKE